MSLSANGMDYGEHTVYYKVLDAGGSLVQQSDTIQVNLLHVVRKKNKANSLINNLPSLPKNQN